MAETLEMQANNFKKNSGPPRCSISATKTAEIQKTVRTISIKPYTIHGKLGKT